MCRKCVLILFVFITGTSSVIAQTFFPLGNGIKWCGVRTLFADNSTNILYVGGNYSQLGNGLNTQGISSWDGSKWDSLRSGLDYNGICVRFVSGITKYNNEIWVCGSFDSIGNKKLTWGARWNGNSWNALPGGTQKGFYNGRGMIWNYFTSGSDLYALGGFDSIGGIASNKIAKWNGTNWTSFPTLDTTGGGWAITCAAIYNGELYVGGNFDSQLSPKMKDIAKWNGTSWQPVGNGLSGFFTWVDHMCVYKGELYVSGHFLQSSGDPGNHIAKWNGISWSPLGSGCVAGNVFTMEVFNNELYVGGSILSAGGNPAAKYIAKWDGSQWYNLSDTLDNDVTCFAVMNNTLYVGGGFWTINSDSLMSSVAGYSSASLGVADISENNETRISPNPNTGRFMIDCKTFNSEKIELYNSTGELVYTDIMDNRKKEIDLAGKANGLYFIRIGSQTKKIIKE